MRKRMSKTVSVCMMAGCIFAGTQTIPALAAETETVVETEAETVNETVPAETAPTTEDAETDKETAKETAAAEETEAVTEAVQETEAQTESETAAETETEASMEGELIFAQCGEYINVRREANTDSEVAAKMYNNDSAIVISQVGDWYEIQSGNAHGYVSAEYFATGEEADAIAQQVAYNVAVVHPDELNVRSNPSEDGEVIDVAYSSEELEVVEYKDDWMKVALGNDVYGYVNAYYVEYKTYYPTAETVEEEAARLSAEEAAAAQEEEQEYAAEETYQETEAVYTETEPVYTETEPVYTETEAPVETEPVYTETEASTSGLGQDIVNYAAQFVGNPYVYGGTSLTDGADCSGFVQSVFANYGIYLSRTADAQAGNGTSVDLGSIQPGDLLFYSSSGGYIDHVAIYAGNGAIVHAANSSSGICWGDAYYSTPVCAVRCW